MPLDGGNLVPDMDRAYAIQEAAEAILRDEQGVRAVGYKIAGTNPATRAHLKIDAAFHGRLYDRPPITLVVRGRRLERVHAASFRRPR